MLFESLRPGLIPTRSLEIHERPWQNGIICGHKYPAPFYLIAIRHNDRYAYKVQWILLTALNSAEAEPTFGLTFVIPQL